MFHFRNPAGCAGDLDYPRVATAVLRRVLIAACLMPAATMLQADDAVMTPLALEEAVAQAVAANPGLAGTRARAAALAAVPSQAGTLPDPMLRLDVMNLPTDSYALDREPMTQFQIGLEQEVPFPGKLPLAARAAEQDADAAVSNVDEARLGLVHDVRRVWWQIFQFDRALDIVLRNQDLLRQFVQIAQTKYKVGEGLQQEVLLAQVELTRLFDRRIELEGMRRQEAARLNALLDRDAETVVVLPVQVDERLPEMPPERDLQERARIARPLLAQRQHEVEAARTRRDLARRDRNPDFRIGVAYGLRDGREPNGEARSDFLSFGVGMTLPLYAGRKQDRAVEQRGSELLQSRYTLQDEAARVRAEIAAAHADYRRATEQVALYRTGLLPQARQSVASMLSGYQVNKVDFLNLVRSQITLYDYETQYWKSFSEAHQALASLAAAVGGEVIE